MFVGKNLAKMTRSTFLVIPVKIREYLNQMNLISKFQIERSRTIYVQFDFESCADILT
jgi:hypothetical protein